MQQSVVYQDIVQKQAFRMINRQINRRFREVDLSLIERIRALSIEQLEELGEAILDFSNITDVLAFLNQQNA